MTTTMMTIAGRVTETITITTVAPAVRGAVVRTTIAADGVVVAIKASDAIRAATITAPMATVAEAAIAVTAVAAIANTTVVEAGWAFRSDPPERP